MGLLQKLLSTLGLRESRTGRGSERARETTVTVEHEPDTASESAVKGTDGATASTGTSETAAPTGGMAEEDAGLSESADTASSTESTDEAGVTAEIEETEPEESATDEAEEDTGAAEEDTGAAEGSETVAEEESETAEPAAGSDESTDVLNGIGPAYAERLENAGVESVADLAAADAADLADETGLGEGRISNWIEQAKDY